MQKCRIKATLLFVSFALPVSSFAAVTVKQTGRTDDDDPKSSVTSDAKLRLRPSGARTIEYSSPKLQPTVLSDHWKVLIENSQLESDFDVEFEKLLKEARHSSIHKSKTASRSNLSNEVTLSSFLLSTGLSLLAILGITCVSSLSIILYKLPMLPVLSSRKKTNPVQYSNLKSFLTKRLIPKAFRVTYKMVLMDFWRNLWLETFSSLRDLYYNINRVSYYETIWERYAPGWLRRGVRAYIVKNIQNEFQLIFGSWISSGVGLMTTSTWLDESLTGDSLIDGEMLGIDDDSDDLVDNDNPTSNEPDTDIDSQELFDAPEVHFDESSHIMDVPEFNFEMEEVNTALE